MDNSATTSEASSDRSAIKQERLQSRLGPEVQEFRDSRLTLQLATLNPHGKPQVSYTPFAFTQQGYYILISDIAEHGKNIKVNKGVSIMMVEDEAEAKNVYARKRLTFDTVATLIEKTSDEGEQAIAALRERFGVMADNLSQLGDFNLYRLTPNSGRYVKGFGQAFNVSGGDLVSFVHLTEGHIQKEKNA
jgi:heme utilization protein HutZ